MKISKHLLFLSALFAAMFVFFVYTQLFSTFEQREFIAIYNVDKFFHALGGIFIVSALQYIWPNKKLGYLVALLLLGTIVWEAFEWVALPEVRESFMGEYVRWKADTVQDIIVGIIAGLIYLLGGQYRKEGHEIQQIGKGASFHVLRSRHKQEGKARIMELFKQKEKITNNDVEELLAVSDATATRYFDALEKEGKIIQKSDGKYTFYTKI